MATTNAVAPHNNLICSDEKYACQLHERSETAVFEGILVSQRTIVVHQLEPTSTSQVGLRRSIAPVNHSLMRALAHTCFDPRDNSCAQYILLWDKQIAL
jgi:hypothetical protein